jgi:uncharacterized iron-regulated protein
MKTTNRFFLPITFLTSILLVGCAAEPLIHPPRASIQGSPGHHLAGQIIHLESGTVLHFEDFIEELQSKQVIFIGEVHDNPDHHLMQTQLLQSLLPREGFGTVAMEFFEQRQQPIIDAYLEGNLTEKEFLEKVNWRKTWGFDYHFYRPLMIEIKQHRARVAAINAPREVIRKTARVGLESLYPEERRQLAQEIDLSNTLHREFVREAYELHGHRYLKDFQFFYEAQCAWEDTMAENVSHILAKGEKVIVFAGNGHIIHKFGIPDRTIGRVPVSSVTVVLYPTDRPAYIERGTADYVWLSRACSKNVR